MIINPLRSMIINKTSLSFTIIPIVVYSNADTSKIQIIKEIKGKSGIYRWINNKNGKSYIGSSVNLSARLYRYYSLAHITAQSKHSLKCKSLVKYGYSSFTFEILEYCNKDEVLVREQYYLDLLKPEYNILSVAGSPVGYLHTEEAKLKMRGARTLTPEHLIKIKQHILKINTQRAIPIEVFDTEKGSKVEYASVRSAAREFNCNETTIRTYLKTNKPFLGRYIITKKTF